MEFSDVTFMDVDFSLQVKTEVEEEVPFSDPLEMEPLSAEQGGFFEEITVKAEILEEEEVEEEAGQFVLENKDTEVKQEYYPGPYCIEDQTVWLSETLPTESKPSERGYCHRCRDDFVNISAHYSLVHGTRWEKNPGSSAENVKTADTKCPICEIVYLDLIQLRGHIVQAHMNNEQSEQCPLCCKKFHQRKYLLKHIENVHNTNKKIGKISMKKNLVTKSVKEIDTKCPICGEIYPDLIQLREHTIQAHMKDESEQCPYCSIKFFLKKNLFKHIKISHSRDEKMDKKCHICDIIFPTLTQLRAHRTQAHLTLKYMNCPYCKDKFLGKEELAKHMKKFHIKISYLNCPHCNDKFIDKKEFLKHIDNKHRMNVRLKSMMKCNICEKDFSNISRHLIEKHNASTKSFQCHDATFNIVWTYCPVCQKNFTSIRGVYKHIRFCHATKHKKELDGTLNEVNIDVPLNKETMIFPSPAATSPQNVLPKIKYYDIPSTMYFAQNVLPQTKSNDVPPLVYFAKSDPQIDDHVGPVYFN